MKYAVTGATGAFGSLAVKELLARGVPASSVVALARDEAKTRALRELGVTVALANYEDKESLVRALSGVDRLLLVSGSEVGRRAAQHHNVIEAARAAKVAKIAYTSLIQADTSPNPLAPEHVATEADLASSGIDYVILRNNWYTENFLGSIGGAKQSGIISAAVKTGLVASALRREYAEAAVVALMGDDNGGRIYELAGKPWSYGELASTVAALIGGPVAFKSVSEEEQKAQLEAAGLPAPMAAFFAAVDVSIEAGSLAHTSKDLATLLGRPALDLKSALLELGV